MKMLDSLKSIPNKIVLYFFVLFFIILRLPGISLPYHQDEMKNALVMEVGGEYSKIIHHPPLTQILYRASGWMFDGSNLRLFPFLFSLASLVLIFNFVKKYINSKSAFFSVFLFSVSAYSVWASLMLDTDGAVLPMFLLVSFLSYYRWRDSGEGFKNKWLFLTILFSILGFLIKLSFIIPIGAIIFDFVWDKRNKISKKNIINGLLYFSGFIFITSFLMLMIRYVYPNFEISSMISHALSFVDFSNRNYLQIFIQIIKSIFYLSPLLIIPIFFISKEVLHKTRIFFITLFLGLFFYLVLFDFGEGALDKYLMFLIVPLSIISGSIISSVFDKSILKTKYLLFGIIISSILFCLNFVTHTALALYPKTEWFSRVIHGELNLLFPLTGGSGPLGFYMSFLFIFSCFSISIFLGLLGLFKKEWRERVVLLIIFIGIVYNAVFIEELLFGKINGSSEIVLNESIDFIKKTDEIKKVITYSDSGTYELQSIGKSLGRFYGVPGYEEDHKKMFEQNRNNAHFLVVDFPLLFNPSFYRSFFNNCNKVFETRSGNISAYVYDCKNR